MFTLVMPIFSWVLYNVILDSNLQYMRVLIQDIKKFYLPTQNTKYKVEHKKGP